MYKRSDVLLLIMTDSLQYFFYARELAFFLHIFF